MDEISVICEAVILTSLHFPHYLEQNILDIIRLNDMTSNTGEYKANFLFKKYEIFNVITSTVYLRYCCSEEKTQNQLDSSKLTT